MFELLKVRRARRLAHATLDPFLRGAAGTADGLQAGDWLHPQIIGFLATLVTLVAQRDCGPMRSDTLAAVQADVLNAVTGIGPELIGEEICLWSSRADPALPKGFSAGPAIIEPLPVAPQAKLSWFQRLRQGLSRTSSQLTGQIAALFTKRKLDEQTLQDLEDLLIQADLGVETAMRVTDTLSSERYGKDVTGEDVSRIMASEITKVLTPVAKPIEIAKLYDAISRALTEAATVGAASAAA